MGELEPDDSRDVTGSTHTAPGEPPRTGPREDAARAAAGQQPQQGGATGAQQGFATEGDSPQHPDRFSGGAASDEAEGRGEASGGDRWHRQAEAAESADDGEDYVPEGK